MFFFNLFPHHWSFPLSYLCTIVSVIYGESTFTGFLIFRQLKADRAATLSLSSDDPTLMHAASILIRAQILHCNTKRLAHSHTQMHIILWKCFRRGRNLQNLSVLHSNVQHVESFKSSHISPQPHLYHSPSLSMPVRCRFNLCKPVWRPQWEPSALQKLEEAVSEPAITK